MKNLLTSINRHIQCFSVAYRRFRWRVSRPYFPMLLFPLCVHVWHAMFCLVWRMSLLCFLAWSQKDMVRPIIVDRHKLSGASISCVCSEPMCFLLHTCSCLLLLVPLALLSGCHFWLKVACFQLHWHLCLGSFRFSCPFFFVAGDYGC